MTEKGDFVKTNYTQSYPTKSKSWKGIC